MKKKELKSRINATIDPECNKYLKKESKAQGRNYSNFLNFIIKESMDADKRTKKE